MLAHAWSPVYGRGSTESGGRLYATSGPDETSERVVGHPILVVEHVRLRYQNGALGVSDVSYDVRPGQVVALLGPNGAGKTSSARCAGGFMRSERARIVAGSVVLYGADVTNAEPHRQARRGLVLVPERNKCFVRLSVEDNLFAVGRPPRGARRHELIDMIHTLFPVLAARRHQQAGKLSGGERQMLALGRSLMSRPRLLMMDEPSLGLSPLMRDRIQESITQVHQAWNLSVILVEQDTALALEVGQRVYVLDSGRVVREGPPAVIAQDPMIREVYLGIT